MAIENPESTKYLFYIAKAYSIPIIKPLVDVLENNNQDYRFYISDRVKKHFPTQWNPKKILHSINETKMFQPHFVFSPGNFVDHRIPGAKVQLFHGLGVEKAAHFKIRHFFDIYLTSGPYVTERFNQLREANPYFDVIETGWSKIDYILRFQPKNLREEFNIAADKKIILYAPTFSAKMESATDLLPVIPKTIKENEFWFLKFHELMPDDAIDSVREQLPANAKIIDRSVDITTLLHVSDLMISDTSSVVYEFMVLKKPVITYKTIAREDKCFNINSINELRPAIDDVFSAPERFELLINKQLDEINPYLDGNISTRVIELLNTSDHTLYPKKKKPLNLYRKLQIIYHSIFKKGYLR